MLSSELHPDMFRRRTISPTGDQYPQTQWLANLLFYSKLYHGQQFQITEENF